MAKLEYKYNERKVVESTETNRPRKRKNKKTITVIMHPIDDVELYKKSLGRTMLDILEKQLGPELLALSMEEIKKKREL